MLNQHVELVVDVYDKLSCHVFWHLNPGHVAGPKTTAVSGPWGGESGTGDGYARARALRCAFITSQIFAQSEKVSSNRRREGNRHREKEREATIALMIFGATVKCLKRVSIYFIAFEGKRLEMGGFHTLRNQVHFSLLFAVAFENEHLKKLNWNC